MAASDQPYPFNILSKIVEEQRKANTIKLGWSLLEDSDEFWDRFSSQFGFTPSMTAEDWPSIIEPTPSKTFDVKEVFGGTATENARLLILLAETYQSVFERAIADDECVVVLDWQHDCYLYNPHSGFDYKKYEDWPIEPYPNGDYYIFLTTDLSNGFFGHPWEKTICVFGGKFLSALNAMNCNVLSKTCRVNGKAI